MHLREMSGYIQDIKGVTYGQWDTGRAQALWDMASVHTLPPHPNAHSHILKKFALIHYTSVPIAFSRRGWCAGVTSVYLFPSPAVRSIFLLTHV